MKAPVFAHIGNQDLLAMQEKENRMPGHIQEGSLLRLKELKAFI